MVLVCCGVDMDIEHIAVIGSGQMGNGIAQVASCAGYSVTMVDIEQEYLDNGMNTIIRSLNRLVAKERMSQEDADKQFQSDNKKDWDYMINEKKDPLYSLFHKLFLESNKNK